MNFLEEYEETAILKTQLATLTNKVSLLENQLEKSKKTTGACKIDLKKIEEYFQKGLSFFDCINSSSYTVTENAMAESVK